MFLFNVSIVSFVAGVKEFQEKGMLVKGFREGVLYSLVYMSEEWEENSTIRYLQSQYHAKTLGSSTIQKYSFSQIDQFPTIK